MPGRQPKVPPSIGDDAVRAKTGKTWREWFAILDRAHAEKKSHKEIVAYLAEHHQVGPWWQQMVTVTYEQARGLRAKHERPEGFSISVSKTIAAPVGSLFASWKDKRARTRWLPNESLTIRKATPDRSIRITWGDGKTDLDVGFYPKGKNKTQVTVQHGKLADARLAARQKTFWTQALERLKATVER